VRGPFLSLWPYLWRACGVCALLAVTVLPTTVGMIALTVATRDSGTPTLVGALPLLCFLVLEGACVVVWVPRLGWLVRFRRAVRGFRSVTHGRIVLHYAPALAERWDFAVFLEECHADLDHLARRFGFPLRGRVTIWLFARCRDVAQILGPRYGGAALCLANAVLVADDHNVRECLRHEFVHLFSARWNPFAPPLIAEGLSVWLQAEDQDRRLDERAQRWLARRGLRLRLLLKRSFFFAEANRHACYGVAGSFTGFLIRRFGWERYQQFFRTGAGWRVLPRFEQCFGMSLDKAEGEWRTEILALEVLRRRLRGSPF
jgi:hypothetical protein